MPNKRGPGFNKIKEIKAVTDLLELGISKRNIAIILNKSYSKVVSLANYERHLACSNESGDRNRLRKGIALCDMEPYKSKFKVN